jgi:hypothetical protein
MVSEGFLDCSDSKNQYLGTGLPILQQASPLTGRHYSRTLCTQQQLQFQRIKHVKELFKSGSAILLVFLSRILQIIAQPNCHHPPAWDRHEIFNYLAPFQQLTSARAHEPISAF